MSAHFLKAQENRVVALRAVAARNSGPSNFAQGEPMTLNESRRAKFSVVDGRAASPWQPEGRAAA